MNENEIFEKVEEIFREIFEDNSLTVTAETTADDIEAWDSFNHINIVASIEKEFNVNFALGELEDLKNVGEFVSLLEKKL